MYSRIKELRKKAGLTQTQLGKILHVSQGTISSYESGDTPVDAEMLQSIAEYFNVSTDYILNRDDKADIPNGNNSPQNNSQSTSALTDEVINRIVDAVRVGGEAPRTPEARIVSFGMDNVPQEIRDKLLNIILAVVAGTPEERYFKENINDR